MTASAEAFEGWAILEIMGHRQVAGFVRDVVLFGTQMARVDVPEVPGTTRRTWEWDEVKRTDVPREVAVPAIPAFTHYYGGSAIFSCVPTTEELARAAAARFRATPPQPLAPASRQLEAAAPPPDAELVEETEPCSECGARNAESICGGCEQPICGADACLTAHDNHSADRTAVMAPPVDG